MRKLLLLALGATAIGCNSSQQTAAKAASAAPVDPMTYANTITEEELKDYLYTYASDAFEGRETGEPGQKKAVEYLKANYEKMGIPAAQSNGDYFQKVPLVLSKLPSGSLTLNGTEYTIGDAFLSFSPEELDVNEIVYVGYGIDEPNYSDYQNVDVKGKVVLTKFGEPKSDDGNYILSGDGSPSKWSNLSEAMGKRVDAAKEQGAIGILYYDDQNFARYKRYYEYMHKNDSGRMGFKEEKEGALVNILLTEDLAKTILPSITTDATPKSIPAQLSINLTSKDDSIDTENVVAVLKGTEKPDEYVVISSHLDHIGVSADGNVNNGADDDGSGSVAMLEIAQAFKAAADAGNGPKRSIVFLHVTGEEKGLLGSRYYSDFDPIFPLSQTVVDLNIDMIGRIDPEREGNRNYIYLIGSDKLSTELHELSEAVNEKYMGIELDYTYNDENDPNRFYYRSDHYNFAKNNIPIIFYFNGTHADYHKPSDTPDKINYDLLENRSRLVFLTAWEIADRDQRLVVDKAPAE